MNAWLVADGLPALDAAAVLDAPDLDHAVARGAAYYGLARRGRGVRIRGGAPRTYYVGIESAMPAVPGLRSAAQGAVRRPLRHGGRHRGAHRRPRVRPGRRRARRVPRSSPPPRASRTRSAQLIEEWGDDIEELHPLEVTLAWPGQEQALVPVRLESRVTEVGTLELWLVARDGEHRWKLEWNIREKATR